MKKVIVLQLFILCIMPIHSICQFSNDLWCFGDSAAIKWSSQNNPIVSGSSVLNRGGSVSILDTISGAFVYACSNTGSIGPNTKVWNKFNQLIQNGSGLEGEGWYHEFQLLPSPSSDSLLILFGIGVTGNGPFGL